MGGHAFDVIADRVTTAERKELFTIIQNALQNCTLRLTRAVPGKEDHGDIDILTTAVSKKLPEIPNSIASTHNGNIISHLVVYNGKKVQVDFMMVPNAQDEMALFAYEDLFVIVGFCVKKWKLKLRHTGLYVTKELPNSQMKDYMLSSNFETICSILGLSYSTYKAGFKDIDSLFGWTLTMQPTIDPDIYKNPSHRLKKQYLSRPIFKQYIDWLQNQQLLQLKTRSLEDFITPEIEKAYNDDIESAKHSLQRRKTIKEKVMQIKQKHPGISGRLIGEMLVESNLLD